MASPPSRIPNPQGSAYYQLNHPRRRLGPPCRCVHWHIHEKRWERTWGRDRRLRYTRTKLRSSSTLGVYSAHRLSIIPPPRASRQRTSFCMTAYINETEVTVPVQTSFSICTRSPLYAPRILSTAIQQGRPCHMPAHFRDRRTVEGLAQLNSLFRDHVTNISLNRPPRSWAKSESCRMCFRTLLTSTCTRRLCSKKYYQCTATIHARKQQDYEAAAGVLPD